MKIYCIFNNKGGVGKTTSTFNFAYILSQKKFKVLVVDVDPQSNLTECFNSYNPENDLSIVDIFENGSKVKDTIKNTKFNNLDIINSNSNLSYVQPSNSEINEDNLFTLKNSLKEIYNNYDICLIDCQPAFNFITQNALIASNDVLVPIEVGVDELRGLRFITTNINLINDNLNTKINFKGCFITRFIKNTKISKEFLRQINLLLDDKAFQNTVRHSVDVKYSRAEELPLLLYNKRSKVSKDYENLAEEIFI